MRWWIFGGIGAAVILILAASIYFSGVASTYFPTFAKTQTEPELLSSMFSDCEKTSNGVFYFCCQDRRRTVACSNFILNCSEYVVGYVNLSALNVPDSYVLCMKTLAWNLSTDYYVGDLGNSLPLANNTYEFQCSNVTYSKNEQHGASSFGRIPNVSGNVTYIELYAFPCCVE
jgi:hypothetical protein